MDYDGSLPIASTSTADTASPSLASQPPPAKPKVRRARTGCLPCRRRKKRCPEEKPGCSNCGRLGLTCEWEDAEQAQAERARRRKEKRLAKQEAKQAEEEGIVAEAAGQGGGSGLELSSVPLGWGAAGTWGGPAVEHGREAVEPYNPAHPGILPFSYSSSIVPSAPPLPVASTSQAHDPWMPFLGSFAPAPFPATNEAASTTWSTAFSGLVTPHTPQNTVQPASDVFSLGPLALPIQEQSSSSQQQLTDAQHSLDWLTSNSPSFDLSQLLRSPTPPPPFAPVFMPSFDNLTLPFAVFDTPSLPSQSLPAHSTSVDALALVARPGSSPSSRLPAVQSAAPSAPLASLTQAASLLVSSDFAFIRSYLLSHYTTSLAQIVSLAHASSAASASSSSGGSSSSRSRSRPPRSTFPRATTNSSANAASATASANLFLSLVPLAHRNPPLLNAILSWSAANLAAASTERAAAVGPAGGVGSGGEGNSVMASLSDELGAVSEKGVEEFLPRLREQLARSEMSSGAVSGGAQEKDKVDFEPILAALLMLSQASICRGDVALWRTRLRLAASVVTLVGPRACRRTPLARALVKNLLYHDVLSSSATKDGLLLDYQVFRRGDEGGKGAPPGSVSEGTSPANWKEDEEDGVDDGEDEEVLDTLMGTAENVFILIGRCTSLAKDKHHAVQQGEGAIAEDDLAAFLTKVEEVKGELELEKERADAFMLQRPDLAPHRYFHEVFRLAALLYLQMLLEMPPCSLPVILLVRKMLSLTEIIVEKDLPGMCSMHWPLYVMHLNATPLISPHATSDDRARSTALFDKHMGDFSFLNTKRSRALVAEAWTRSTDGKTFVDPDALLQEWGWEQNFA